MIGDKSLEKFSILGPLIYDFPIPEGNQVEIFDLKFPSPLIGASFKSEKAIMSMWMRMGLGGTIYKTIMAKKIMVILFLGFKTLFMMVEKEF